MCANLFAIFHNYMRAMHICINLNLLLSFFDTKSWVRFICDKLPQGMFENDLKSFGVDDSADFVVVRFFSHPLTHIHTHKYIVNTRAHTGTSTVKRQQRNYSGAWCIYPNTKCRWFHQQKTTHWCELLKRWNSSYKVEPEALAEQCSWMVQDERK